MGKYPTFFHIVAIYSFTVGGCQQEFPQFAPTGEDFFSSKLPLIAVAVRLVTRYWAKCLLLAILLSAAFFGGANSLIFRPQAYAELGAERPGACAGPETA
jgi:hypothetical protein